MRIYKKGKDSPLFIDLTNKRFGNLIAIEYGNFKNKNGKMELKWKCKCDCGRFCYIRSKNLSDGLRIDCKICSKKRQSKNQTLPKQQSILNRIFRNYRRNAINKNREFNLSLDEFTSLLNKKCYYCNVDPKNDSLGYMRNGIDRINSNVGYIKNNVVSCCEKCNRAKMDIEQTEFLKWLKMTYEHLKSVGIIT